MTPDELRRIQEANNEVLDPIRDWFLLDSDARALSGSFGEQEIHVQWENGRVVRAWIAEKHTLKPGKLGLPKQKRRTT